ncbi:MAG: hypothetical protein ACLR39_05990 [Oscillospiraceae bacterium]
MAFDKGISAVFAGVKISPAGGFASLLRKASLSIKIFPQIILLNERSQANISSSTGYLLKFFIFRHDIAFLFLI